MRSIQKSTLVLVACAAGAALVGTTRSAPVWARANDCYGDASSATADAARDVASMEAAAGYGFEVGAVVYQSGDCYSYTSPHYGEYGHVDLDADYDEARRRGRIVGDIHSHGYPEDPGPSEDDFESSEPGWINTVIEDGGLCVRTYTSQQEVAHVGQCRDKNDNSPAPGRTDTDYWCDFNSGDFDDPDCHDDTDDDGFDHASPGAGSGGN
jgi:hypothetical protein